MTRPVIILISSLLLLGAQPLAAQMHSPLQNEAPARIIAPAETMQAPLLWSTAPEGPVNLAGPRLLPQSEECLRGALFLGIVVTVGSTVWLLFEDFSFGDSLGIGAILGAVTLLYFAENC